jgi:hypothetical protein
MFSRLPWLPNFHRKTLVTLFIAYVFLVILVTLAILATYVLIFPGTLGEGIGMLKQGISASFNLGGYKDAAPSPLRDDPGVVVMLILFAHAFAILVLNMIFQAVITAKLIKPAIHLHLSDGAVFHPSYGLNKTPHILFRLINASPFDLHLVSIKAFLIVHDEHKADPNQSMTYYFPVPEVDPLEIPVLRTLNPWIVAIPVDENLANSLIHDYEWRLTRPAGSHPGKRQLEVLVSGNETEASTSFMRAFNINLEPEGKAGLICGAFQPLPSLLPKRNLGLINKRLPTREAACAECREKDCRFRPVPAGA